MNAIQLMLKSFGFDPVEVMENVKNMGMMITQMYESQQRTEALVRKLVEKLDGPEKAPGPGLQVHDAKRNGADVAG